MDPRSGDLLASLPKKWRNIIIVITLLGSFAGGKKLFWQKDPEPPSEQDNLMVDRLDDLAGLPREVKELRKDIADLRKKINTLDANVRDANRKTNSDRETDYAAILDGLAQVSSDIQSKLKRR